MYALIRACELCPRRCRAARLDGETGWCRLGGSAVVSTVTPHFGEEPPLVGTGGSGTVFFTGCNAGCIFCQNYQISHLHHGEPISVESLAAHFISLQKQGCHNINLVSPDPHLPFIVEALALAVEAGMRIPVVYNTNGYMPLEIVRLLDGIVDIYMPDFKYGEDVWAEKFSKLPDYFDITGDAIQEMYRQVGILNVDSRGVARRGLLVRHLILPEGSAGSRKVFRRIASIDPEIHISLLSQYQPRYLAYDDPVLNRGITTAEFRNALEAFQEAGLRNGFFQAPQDFDMNDPYFPDFFEPPNRVFI